MNKKLPAILIVSFFTLIFNYAFSQCTPDPNNLTLISPDTVTNFATGTVGVPYSQTAYVHPPVDTMVPGILFPVTIVNIHLDNVSNLPPGLSVFSNPTNQTFPGGVSGCLQLAGTPTVAGLYELRIFITTNATVLGIPLSQSDTIEAYKILILPDPTGITTFNSNPEFSLTGFGPNPVTDHIQLSMFSPINSNVRFSFSNIIGKEIYTTSQLIIKGQTSLNLPLKNLSQGIYFLTIQSNNKKIIRRFVMAGK